MYLSGYFCNSCSFNSDGLLRDNFCSFNDAAFLYFATVTHLFQIESDIHIINIYSSPFVYDIILWNV